MANNPAFPRTISDFADAGIDRLRDCPLCGQPDPAPSVFRQSIPVFQNVTYPTAPEARAAPTGGFVLSTCRSCGFSYNGRFDPGLAEYDESYDNHVESAAFKEYYRRIAAMLVSRVGLHDGSVYEIGCGQGEFLKELHALAPGVRAVGVDPACRATSQPNLEFINGYFDPARARDDAKLLIVRHVLEHIAQPVQFLRSLREGMPNTPLYVEVPDLDWIFDNRSFWDFCYEHCNYFTTQSLAAACAEAGYSVLFQNRSFGDQYQWALCLPGGAAGDRIPGHEAWAKAEAYAAEEANSIAQVAQLARERGGVGVWGMATKGVLLCSILDADLVCGGIDMNPTKQGRFASGSGVKINPPDWLATQPPGRTVFVMNPNYLTEIAGTVERLGASVTLETI
jgi:SAM-dependent methyltransferase